jgi:hypothetical protein
MYTLIVVAGMVWLTLAGWAVLALARAAQGEMPQPSPFPFAAD